jgi:acetyl esterase/lipase
MPIRVSCSGCAKTYNVPDRYAGKSISCKDCGEQIAVPEAEDEWIESKEEEPRRRSRPRPGRNRDRRAEASSGMSGTMKVLLGAAGGGLLVMVLCCGGLTWSAKREVDRIAQQQAAMPRPIGVAPPMDPGLPPTAPPVSVAPAIDPGPPTSRFPLEKYPLPQFPESGTTRTLQPSGVSVQFVEFASVPANLDGPGMRMPLRVYLPPGDHAERSLACVLVAPAGTNMLTGNEVDNDDYHAETLPYAEAGMAVVMYSLDGGIDREQVETQIRGGYTKFRAAGAGTVNGRNAVEYVLARLPQVDPERIYSAGHSSAGTASLLLAMHEPRIKRCIAYAPVADVVRRLQPLLADPSAELLLPGVRDFATKSSPTTHLNHVMCPVFLFHARDDSNVPIADTLRFADALRTAGKTVMFEEAASGDHYDSMVKEGIPRAIRWLKQ